MASFFVSRVDTEVDRRLEAIGTPQALGLRGRAALAQAKLAHRLFRARFSGPPLASLDRPGRPAPAAAGGLDLHQEPAYLDTVYADGLIGPDTITTLPEATIAAFEDHGTLAATITQDIDDAQTTLERLAQVGIDLNDVARVLEDEGVQHSPRVTTGCRCCRPERMSRAEHVDP